MDCRKAAWSRSRRRQAHRQAISRLSPTARIAFALHELDGRSVAQVADCVGASVTATKLRIWRARRALFKEAANDPVLSEFLADSPAAEETR